MHTHFSSMSVLNSLTIPWENNMLLKLRRLECRLKIVTFRTNKKLDWVISNNLVEFQIFRLGFYKAKIFRIKSDLIKQKLLQKKVLWRDT